MSSAKDMIIHKNNKKEKKKNTDSLKKIIAFAGCSHLSLKQREHLNIFCYNIGDFSLAFYKYL